MLKTRIIQNSHNTFLTFSHDQTVPNATPNVLTGPLRAISTGDADLTGLGLDRGGNDALRQVEVLTKVRLALVREVPVVVAPRELLLDEAARSERLQWQVLLWFR